MIDYYEEALLEAVVFCITKGMTEEYVVSLDVDGFGDVYKYLKRIDAREQKRFISHIGLAFNGTKKGFREVEDILNCWLPKPEIAKTQNNAGDFKKLVDKGKF